MGQNIQSLKQVNLDAYPLSSFKVYFFYKNLKVIYNFTGPFVWPT